MYKVENTDERAIDSAKGQLQLKENGHVDLTFICEQKTEKHSEDMISPNCINNNKILQVKYNFFKATLQTLMIALYKIMN